MVPEIDWLPWVFSGTHLEATNEEKKCSPEKQRKYLEWVKNNFNLKSLEKWDEFSNVIF